MFSLKQAIDLTIARAFSITGRSSRAEYWWTLLIYMFLITSLCIASVMLLQKSEEWGIFLAFISCIILILLYVILLFTSIRRLHDVNLNGWWILISFIPMGGLVLFVLVLMPSQSGVNRFGISPTEDPQGHYNYYTKKMFKTGGAYGAPAQPQNNYVYMQQQPFNQYGSPQQPMQGQPMYGQPMYGQNMQGQPMYGQQPVQGQPLYEPPVQQPQQPNQNQ